MSSRRPQILDEIGAELVRAARAAERERRRPRLGISRAVALAVGAALLIAAGAVAAGLVIGRGDPIPPAPAGQVPVELRPVPGTARLNGLDVPDPDGGPAWDMRTSRSSTGAICATVGQLLDGELGLVGLDRRFRALPAGAADTCSTPQTHGATLAGARAFRGGGRLSTITVVNGVAAPDVTRAVVVGGGRTQPLTLGPDHAFLAIFRGFPEEVRPRVVLTARDGKSTTLRFADTGEYLAADPSGGAPWTVKQVTQHVGTGFRCVQTRRERGPDSPTRPPAGSFTPNVLTASVPLRCGRSDATFFDVRRFVPFNQTRGTDSWWGLNAARTIAWGAVARTDAVVMLRAPGRARRIAVDPRTHAFAVILDGHVDPRAVRLTVDGVPLTPLANLTGRRGAEVSKAVPTPPAWRSVESVVRETSVGQTFVTDGPAPIARRADDSAGGAPWALRSWDAHVNQKLRVFGSDRAMRCFQVGHPAAGDRLTLPRLDGRPRTLTLDDEGGAFCNGADWLESHAASPMVRVEVDDPSSADPKPLRTVISGLLGDGVRSAELVGAGAPRPLELGPHGTFLVVLDGSQAAAGFQVRQTRTDATVRTSRGDGLETPCQLQPGTNVRVADPDGGPPWVLGRSRVGTRSCSFSSRVVAGHLAYISPDDGTVRFGPSSFSSAPPGARGSRPSSAPLTLGVEGPGGAPARPRTAEPALAPQVARRTLPGRTLVTGHTAADIESVTIRTPRDIRTVKPVGGLYLAVYDGAFYTGEVVVTGHRRDGSTVTKRQAAAFG